MIDRTLVRNYIGQSMLLFLSCALAMFAFAWVRVWVVSLLDMGQFQTILDQVKEFERFAPIEFRSMVSYPGRVGVTYDEPVVILCTVIWCIARGSDVVSGELGRGTMEMLLAQPIERGKLLRSHAVVSVTGLALLCLLVWAGIGIGVQTTTIEETIAQPTFRLPFFEVDVPLTVDEPIQQQVPLNERVDARAYAAATFHLFAFGFFLLGLSSMLSSMDRYRHRTIGAVVGIYVLQLVMFALGKATDKLEWLQQLTFFSCYKPQKMTLIATNDGLSAPWNITETMSGGMLPPLAYPLILLFLGGCFYAVASIQFRRRDLPAPL